MIIDCESSVRKKLPNHSLHHSTCEKWQAQVVLHFPFSNAWCYFKDVKLNNKVVIFKSVWWVKGPIITTFSFVVTFILWVLDECMLGVWTLISQPCLLLPHNKHFYKWGKFWRNVSVAMEILKSYFQWMEIFLKVFIVFFFFQTLI